jgi:hypothetical protein
MIDSYRQRMDNAGKTSGMIEGDHEQACEYYSQIHQI